MDFLLNLVCDGFLDLLTTMTTTKTSQLIQRNILTSFISDSGKISFLRTPVLWMSIPSIQNPPLFIPTVLVPQLCLILCDTMGCNSPGSSVHGISQARILEWVAMPFSRGSSWPRARTQVSCVAGRFFYNLSHQGNPFSLLGKFIFSTISSVMEGRHHV